ncbi:Receptor-type guanylate cyclase gcy [Seminavis robusta]|uniref:Receptor-type guanylate cyclase gcy n=1 Tax=Seminavis robusta TaxID=568900 RepID=A0A9N8EWI8_9STRA|nr:Receptor-type guanylate cyclase gcy [Seminavis robusta]|eukprot:Sro2252_g320860.1 Receptor-type guanylate cyclase gcy (1236) ;mRNA; r:5763-11064
MAERASLKYNNLARQESSDFCASSDSNERAFVDEILQDEPQEDVSVSEECFDEDDEDLEGTGVSSSGRAKSDSDSVVQDPEEDEKIKFTPEMTRNVFRLRMLVIVVLFIAAGVVSFVVFSVSNGGEIEEFESNYEGTATKVLEVFQGIFTEKLDAVASLAIATTAHSVDHKDHWPFSTLSFFQERATAARKQSGTLFTAVVPLVTYEDRDAWENYTRVDPVGWIQEGLDAQDQWDPMRLGVSLPSYAGTVHPGYIVHDDWELGLIRDEGYGPYFPIWAASPVVKGLVNFNLGSLPTWLEEIATSMQKNAVVIGRMLTPPPGNALHAGFLTRFFATLLSIKYAKPTEYQGDPFSYVFFPIFNNFDHNHTSVAVLFTVINWATFFENLLPDNIMGVTLVLENGCDQPFTYTINGPEVVFQGPGDLHDMKYDEFMRTASFKELENRTKSASDVSNINFALDSNECPYSIRIYPSQAYVNMHTTATPETITTAVAGIFIFTALMFLIYDRLVERRQKIILSKATHSTAILSSIYPKNIRDRLLEDAERKDKEGNGSGKKNGNNSNSPGDFMAPNHRLKSFLSGSAAGSMDGTSGGQPLADLFPHTTVLFADIAGFTAWSSVRDPSQVFILLQTLYGAFDDLAKRRRVFKIETIGDCYVAVTGLPKPQDNHAIIMARFAHDCLVRMRQVTRQLISLGPGTDELGIRLGLHSGPVTAGVLRGDRARFQLFGDTVNTAARMESTGVRNRIQVSQQTAALLTAAGKGHWLKARDDCVHAKGKGVLSTFWVLVKRGGSVASSSSSVSDATPGSSVPSLSIADRKAMEEASRRSRLVDWVVEMLLHYMQQICALRHTKNVAPSTEDLVLTKTDCNLDELVDAISLPKIDASKMKVPKEEAISKEAVDQLRNLVTEIAKTYNDNPFHNWDHACHVTMACHKFLQRIISPDLDVAELELAEKNTEKFVSNLHDFTHGINSDPVARTAIIFSALIHDADHRGVSNAQLAREDEAMAEFYNKKSIAEQNSLDICWNMLMSPEYSDLRRCLFANESDMRRFRQVCVNVVLATDIFDKELNDLRKARWNRAFAIVTESKDGQDEEQAVVDASPPEEKPTGNDSGLRATIVIEHIIQASDVSHTMQHWHVYRKWNRLLFHEMHEAYRNGRMGADPAKFWYQGELGFFDNYIIPLARKLKDCNVFGVSSEECLNYALRNREEWQERGTEIVEDLVAELAEKEIKEAAKETIEE